MYSILFCTAQADEAKKIAGQLVEEKRVACVNITRVDSFFRWEGKTESEQESLLIMKTMTNQIGNVVARIKELHSYDVPEIIALPVIDGNDEYLNWVKDSVETPD